MFPWRVWTINPYQDIKIFGSSLNDNYNHLPKHDLGQNDNLPIKFTGT